MNNILIIGSSGHAKVIIDIVEKEAKHKIVGLLDKFRKIGEETLGYKILGEEKDLPRLTELNSIVGGIVAIGDNFIRSKVVTNIMHIYPNFVFVNCVHPKANVAKEVTIGEGTVVMAGVTINPCCTIGRFCILNTNSSLDHDSRMGDFSSLAPNVATGGKVNIGKYSAISIGATIIDGVQIGEYTVIGAGSTVLKDVDSYKVSYGKPDRIMKDRKPGDKYL